MTKDNVPKQFPIVSFTAPLQLIDRWALIVLPEDESMKLSSRGQVSVTGRVNEHEFKTVLEPDGRWGHWFKVSEEMQDEIGIHVGDTVAVELTQSTVWPEPNIPEDFAAKLDGAPANIQRLWHEITPMARWEWVRWVNATRDASTRKRRIEVSISKMKSGKRRPCCFNLAACTDPDVSRNGRLMSSV